MPKSLRNFYNDTELLSEGKNIVEFMVELPISNYVEDNEIPDALNFNYASRDVTRAETQAEKNIMDQLELPSFPLSVNLVASFEKFTPLTTIFKITLSGENTTFLKSVRMLNL